MIGRGVLAWLVSAALLFAVVAATRVPWSWSDDDRSIVRLSWRSPVSRVEECRPLTDAERQGRLLHMQRDSICVGRGVGFRLEVDIDEHPVVRSDLPGSPEGDERRLSVVRDLAVEPGRHRVSVRFTPLEGPDAPLELTEQIELTPRQIAVVTIEDGRFVVRSAE